MPFEVSDESDGVVSVVSVPVLGIPGLLPFLIAKNHISPSTTIAPSIHHIIDVLLVVSMLI